MIVMKFGGSSVKDEECIRNVCDIIKINLERKPIVVCSAVGGITDMLIEAAEKALKGDDFGEVIDKIRKRHFGIIDKLKLDKELVEGLLFDFEETIKRISIAKSADIVVMDLVQSFGERISCRIVAAELNNTGIEAKAFDAWDIGMITNSDFGKAEPIDEAEPMLRQNLSNVKLVPVITGFIGKSQNGAITTLGRGGSDYTAAIIGSAIKAEEIQIWTDVDGIMTADPRVVSEAKTIPQISFEESSELAFFGAKVLHPKTILPAMKKNIPVRVLNTYNPKGKGTLILKDASKSSGVVKAIACKKHNILLNINSTRMLGAHGFLARVFDILDEYRKSVDMISTSEINISLTLDAGDNMDRIMKELREVADVKLEKNKSIISVVGAGMYHVPGIAGRTFTALGRNKINVEMISQGASEINISFIVDDKDADEAVKVLHKEYFSSK